MHDLIGLGGVVNLQGVEVLGGAQLELGELVLLVLLDSDLFGLGQVLALPTHDLNEFLQVLNLLGLNTKKSQKLRSTTTRLTIASSTFK